MTTRLEHVNVTVADPDHNASVLSGLFGWHIRWAGAGIEADSACWRGFIFGEAMPGSADS